MVSFSCLEKQECYIAYDFVFDHFGPNIIAGEIVLEKPQETHQEMR